MFSENGKPSYPGAKKLTRRKNETDVKWNLRKAQNRRAAAEREKTRREAEFEATHPSDHPLKKFARIWEHMK